MGKKAIGWNFPVNDDGQENGFNDPGIETFKDDPLSSVAREVLQNSADARHEPSGRPVEVHFRAISLPASDFPGLKSLRTTLQRCLSDLRSFKRTAEFLENAIRVLSAPTIPLLKISDYNTTGIVLGREVNRSSDWYKITKAVGVSDKNPGKLGSFGIGKQAPYACSDLRTVFYGTKDVTGATAFQGVARLPSYTFRDKITQGTGYYGLKSGNKPLLDFKTLPERFKRSRIGADLYVMGFHGYPNWESRIVKSVIESFFVAIHEGRLIVKVANTTLNALTLPAQISKHYVEPDARYFADQYYQVLTSEDSSLYVEEDFQGYGRIRLRILEHKEFRKKVAMFRRSGMKIYDKGHFQTPLRFAGVFTVEGKKLDALLRTLEPPSHNAWEPERGEDPAQTKRLLSALRGWINEKVRELGATENLHEVDAEGMSQYLPDDIEGETGAPRRPESLCEEPAEDLAMRIRSQPSTDVRSSDLEGNGDEEEAGGDEGGPRGDEPTGEDGTWGDGDGGEGQGGDESGGGTGTDRSRRVPLKNVRIYCSDPAVGKYRILFEPQEGTTHLRTFVIGEVGTEPAPISTYTVNGGVDAAPDGGKGVIGPLTLPAGQRATVDVVLRDALRCALGVTAYAD